MNSEFQKSHPTKRTITANQVSFYVNSALHRIWFSLPSLLSAEILQSVKNFV